MYHRDKNYAAVTDGEVKIVDEFTGRIMEGRRWSEGLHQAVEAKEGVLVREENRCPGHDHAAHTTSACTRSSRACTGTALTEDAEFRQIYKLPVQPIPPNRPVIREDNDDLVYRSIDTKFDAVVKDVMERHAKGQPVLVGTVAIESSEKLSRMLTRHGVRHEVLNAKHHEREAAIVAQAGRFGAVTIATNMAGRGTDILLGGNPNFMANDLLLARGVDPAEASRARRPPWSAARSVPTRSKKSSRRAACASSGPSATKAAVSTTSSAGPFRPSGRPGEHPVLPLPRRRPDASVWRRQDGQHRRPHAAHEHARRHAHPGQLITKSVESAQRKVEDMNFAARKHVLEYDDVMNRQRQVIYAERNKILDGKDLDEHVGEVMRDTVLNEVATYVSPGAEPQDWDVEGLQGWVNQLTGREDFDAAAVVEASDDDADTVGEKTLDYVRTVYAEKAQSLGPKVISQLERQVMLRVIDTRWMNYLQEMDYLKTGIGLRGYGQRDPLVEYKEEAYRAFGELVNTMYEDFLRTVLRMELAVRPDLAAQAPASPLAGAHFSGPAPVDGDVGSGVFRHMAPRPAQSAAAAVSKPKTYVSAENDPYAGVGRNDDCPCGSGKKFKNCHGRNA